MFKERRSTISFLKPFFVWLTCCGFLVNVAAGKSLVRKEWKVADLIREGLIFAPSSAKTNAAPLVFAFHGHSGSMSNAAKMFHIETLWPEAIVVYLQGVKTPGRLTDPEGKQAGWQFRPGDHGNRDLKFFDVVLGDLKKEYKVDRKRIYCTGHSNGGSFTYVLLAARGDVFAAMAPSASLAAWAVPDLKPKPLLHLAGENDPLVKFEWQDAMIHAVRKANQCGEGKPWDRDKRCTIYESRLGAPIVTFIHQNKHGFAPPASEIIVKFFKEHSLK